MFATAGVKGSPAFGGALASAWYAGPYDQSAPYCGNVTGVVLTVLLVGVSLGMNTAALFAGGMLYTGLLGGKGGGGGKYPVPGFAAFGLTSTDSRLGSVLANGCIQSCGDPAGGALIQSGLPAGLQWYCLTFESGGALAGSHGEGGEKSSKREFKAAAIGPVE